MISKLIPVLLIALVVVVAGCAQQQAKTQTTPTPAQPASQTPAITFTSPAEGSTVQGPEVTVTFSLSNFEIDPANVGKTNAAGKGHVHGYLDGGSYIAIADYKVVLNKASAGVDLTPGQHSLKLELVNNDHGKVTPAVEKTLTFTVSGAQKKNLVVVKDQDVKDKVLIDKVISEVAGWVVIHSSTGEGIGQVSVNAGENMNVVVPVESSKLTDKVSAMLHIDVGTAGTYEFPGSDIPAKGDDADVNPSFKTKLTVSTSSGKDKVFTNDITHGGYSFKDSTGASLSDLKVKNGDKVIIKATTTPAAHKHGIAVDAFSINTEVTAAPGSTPTEISFAVDRTGVFEIYCKTCESGAAGAHAWMKANLIVE